MDQSLTLTLNQLTAGRFMLFVTEPESWYIPIALLCGVLLALDRKKGLVAIMAAVVAVGIGDALGGHLLKPLFGRLRPCHTMEGLTVLAGCTKSFSFPSNHAINSAAFAVALGLFYRKFLYVGLPLAALVALSRVGVGVHYLSDVVAGSLLGGAIGYGVAVTIRWWFYPPLPDEEFLYDDDDHADPPQPYSEDEELS